MTEEKIRGKILDLIYPPSIYCSCCGNLIDETRAYGLCDHCVRHIRWDTGAGMEKHGMRMIRCTAYGIYERTLIFSLKYNGKKYIARDIARIMADKLEMIREDFDVIVPVPMNRDKRGRRGFDQAALIGRCLSKETGKPMREVLFRNRDTRPMRGLSPAERENNIRGSISMTEGAEALAGRRVLLLDDFFTTGSTAAECGRVLAAAGPASVVLIAFAAKY